MGILIHYKIVSEIIIIIIIIKITIILYIIYDKLLLNHVLETWNEAEIAPQHGLSNNIGNLNWVEGSLITRASLWPIFSKSMSMHYSLNAEGKEDFGKAMEFVTFLKE